MTSLLVDAILAGMTGRRRATVYREGDAGQAHPLGIPSTRADVTQSEHLSDDDLVLFSVRIPRQLRRELRRYVVDHDLTLQDFVTEVLRRQIDEG